MLLLIEEPPVQVFSFIVFYYSHHSMDLLVYVWLFFSDGNSLPEINISAHGLLISLFYRSGESFWLRCSTSFWYVYCKSEPIQARYTRLWTSSYLSQESFTIVIYSLFSTAPFIGLAAQKKVQFTSIHLTRRISRFKFSLFLSRFLNFMCSWVCAWPYDNQMLGAAVVCLLPDYWFFLLR